MPIRIATIADIPALHALIESAYRGESAKRGWTHEADLLGGQRTDVEALHDIIADPAQALLVADEAGSLIGCVLVADKGQAGGQRTAYLGMLSVRPDLQGAGIGRKLVEAAQNQASTFAATVMEMTVIRSRTELISWYRRLGYEDTGRELPFPLDDPRFGLPKTRDLSFVVLAKKL